MLCQNLRKIYLVLFNFENNQVMQLYFPVKESLTSSRDILLFGLLHQKWRINYRSRLSAQTFGVFSAFSETRVNAGTDTLERSPTYTPHGGQSSLRPSPHQNQLIVGSLVESFHLPPSLEQNFFHYDSVSNSFSNFWQEKTALFLVFTKARPPKNDR